MLMPIITGFAIITRQTAVIMVTAKNGECRAAHGRQGMAAGQGRGMRPAQGRGMGPGQGKGLAPGGPNLLMRTKMEYATSGKLLPENKKPVITNKINNKKL